jgi:hypothetical protein
MSTRYLLVFSLLFLSPMWGHDLVIGDSFLLGASPNATQELVLKPSYLEYHGPFNTLLSRLMHIVPAHLGTQASWIAHLKNYKGHEHTSFVLTNQFNQPNNLIKRAKVHLKTPIDRIFVSFSIAPLCAVHSEFVDDEETFAKKIKTLLDYTNKHLDFKQMIWVEPFSVVQIRVDPNILNKSVGDGSRTCAEQYQGHSVADALEMNTSKQLEVLLPSLSCGSLLRAHPETLSRLASRLRNYREEMKKMVDEVRVYDPRIQVLSTSRDYLFKPEEIADDCLHLNEQGQKRIAVSMDEELQSAL